MVLRAGYLAVAEKLQLQEAGMMHSDVAARLNDAVQDAHRGTGKWGNYITHNGDGDSGDCIYSCDGDLRSAPYELGNLGGKATAHIDMDNSKNVVPTTTYQEEADDDDQYAAMEESFKRDRLYTSLPLYERFISKDERSKMSDEDFAGKGKSFPINQPGDIMAAVHSMGRAGDKNVGTSTLKSRIIAIAKRKGWSKYLPKTWRGDSAGASESQRAGNPGQLVLVESAATLETIVLRESKSDYEIKLIAPGKGSSAYYPESVLRRDGPSVFKAGTHVYLNHATAAEEAARPEGDVKNLAGVLTTSAAYHESHAKGPGLYARMKVFADHAQTVEEKAPHVGMSIRASGVAESNRRQDGLPVLKELTHAESVDVVTRAGAGGMILTEAARPGNSQEVDMTEADVKRLLEAERAKWESESTAKTVRALESRALKGDAMVEAARITAPLALREGLKRLAVENVLLRDLPVKEGALDAEKFGLLLASELSRVAEAAGDYQGVRNLGLTTEVVEIDEEKRLKEAKRQRKEEERGLKESESVFAEIMGNGNAAKIAARGRVA